MPPPPVPVPCPRCRRPLTAPIRLQPGGFTVCGHCLGFLQIAAGGPRSLLPGDLDHVPEETRWMLLKQRAELRPE